MAKTNTHTTIRGNALLYALAVLVILLGGLAYVQYSNLSAIGQAWGTGSYAGVSSSATLFKNNSGTLVFFVANVSNATTNIYKNLSTGNYAISHTMFNYLNTPLNLTLFLDSLTGFRQDEIHTKTNVFINKKSTSTYYYAGQKYSHDTPGTTSTLVGFTLPNTPSGTNLYLTVRDNANGAIVLVDTIVVNNVYAVKQLTAFANTTNGSISLNGIGTGVNVGNFTLNVTVLNNTRVVNGTPYVSFNYRLITNNTLQFNITPYNNTAWTSNNTVQLNVTYR